MKFGEGPSNIDTAVLYTKQDLHEVKHGTGPCG
jgi:hypothetical protein